MLSRYVCCIKVRYILNTYLPHTIEFLMSKIIIVFIFILLSNSLLISANDPDFTLYGNEPEFVNNILLTIDDASIESNTQAIFELLHQNGMTATFFPNTRYIRNHNPQLWRDIALAGFDIGYHTVNHSPYMTPEELTVDFRLFQQEIRDILNNPSYTIRYVRPPDGVWDENWMLWANASQLQTVRWNMTTVTDDLGYIEAVLQNRIQGGSIILLHTSYKDIQWLEANLLSLRNLHFDQDQTYNISCISCALAD